MVAKICWFIALKPNQPCEAGLDRLKGLYYVGLQEKQDPSESLTHTYYITKNSIISEHDLEKWN